METRTNGIVGERQENNSSSSTNEDESSSNTTNGSRRGSRAGRSSVSAGTSTTSIWQKVLTHKKEILLNDDEVHAVSRRACSTLLVLGSYDVGKTAVIRVLQQYGFSSGTSSTGIGAVTASSSNSGNSSSGGDTATSHILQQQMYNSCDGASAIDSAYLDIRRIDDEESLASDVLSRCNVWILQQPNYKDILLSRLKPEDLKRMAVLICVDLSKSNTLLIELEKWLKVYTDIISRLLLGLSVDTQTHFRNTLAQYIATYKQSVLLHEEEEIFFEGSARRLRSDSSSNKPQKYDDNAAQESEDSDDEHGGVSTPTCLTCNLGVPLITLVTKSDSCYALDSRQKQGHIDVIQAYIRNTCLPYGSAIIFTNVKDPRNPINCRLLYQYLAHRIYGDRFPFRHGMNTKSNESIFIPSGWDSKTEIDSFATTTVAGSLTSAYETIITRVGDSDDKILGDIDNGLVRYEQMTPFLNRLLSAVPSLLSTESSTTTMPATAITTTTTTTSSTFQQQQFKFDVRPPPAFASASDPTLRPSTPRQKPSSTPSSGLFTYNKSNSSSGGASSSNSAHTDETPKQHKGGENGGDGSSLQSFFQGLLAKGKTKPSLAGRDRSGNRSRPDNRADEESRNTPSSTPNTTTTTSSSAPSNNTTTSTGATAAVNTATAATDVITTTTNITGSSGAKPATNAALVGDTNSPNSNNGDQSSNNGSSSSNSDGGRTGSSHG